jgi:hypothetical protein
VNGIGVKNLSIIGGSPSVVKFDARRIGALKPWVNTARARPMNSLGQRIDVKSDPIMLSPRV